MVISRRARGAGLANGARGVAPWRGLAAASGVLRSFPGGTKKRRRRQGGRRKKQKEESSRGAAKRIQSARGGEAGIKTLLVFLVENLRGFYDYDVGLAVFAR